MGGLYKKEVLIREVSTVSVQAAKDWTKNWMDNTFQNVDSNKDGNGNFIDYFFADIFDARDGNIYRVYTDACISKYSMSTTDFSIIDNSVIALKEDIPKVVNDNVLISGNTATLSEFPIDGEIIGDEIRVVINESANQVSYVSVDFSVSGKVVTLNVDVDGEFSGMRLKASYLSVP